MSDEAALEARVKYLENAIQTAEHKRAKWASAFKIAGVCLVLAAILLVCAGPLLPAVYTLEYFARGGAFRDKPLQPKLVQGNANLNSSPTTLEAASLALNNNATVSKEAKRDTKAKPPKSKKGEKVGKDTLSTAEEQKDQVGKDPQASESGQEGQAETGGGTENLAELVNEKLEKQRKVCLGAPFPVIYGDKGVSREMAFKAYDKTKSSRGYLRNNKLDPVLVAVENQKKGDRGRGRGRGRGRRLLGKEDSLPLKPFCARRRRPVTGNLNELTECLMNPEGCTSDMQSKATSQLNRVTAIRQYLPKKGSPKCLTVNKACNVRPRDLTSAKESGKKIGIKAGERIVAKQPAGDISRNMTTCAIVANGPGLYAHGVGEAIDAHDVVIKMNLYHLGQRPGEFQELDKSASLYSGSKSSIRMFNAKRAEDVMKYTMKPSMNETWIYWHYRTAIQLDTLIKVNPDSRFLSPQHLDNMLELYFAFRTLIIQVAKIRRTKCPINLSTGVHSVLTFIHSCDRVNLFGFSTRWSDMEGRGRRSEVISSRMSRSHDWNVDVMILNLLAISRRINFCTQ